MSGRTVWRIIWLINFAVLLLLLWGCELQPPMETQKTEWKGIRLGNVPGYSDVSVWYSTVKIDGCDYLFTHAYRESCLTHKGDCGNLIHKHFIIVVPPTTEPEEQALPERPKTFAR